jgi:hypothetical protein
LTDSSTEILWARRISKENKVRKNPCTINKMPIKDTMVKIAINGLRKIRNPVIMLSTPARSTTLQNLY